MRLLERVILKCEGSVVLKAIESTECVGDSEKARLGNAFLCGFRPDYNIFKPV